MDIARTVMKYVVLQDLAISVAAPGKLDGGAISDADMRGLWDIYEKAPITRYLGATMGQVALSSVQRKTGADMLRKRGIRTAVVTDDAIVRGFVTAVGWMGLNTSAFSWADLKGAMKYLEVTGALEERAMSMIAKLRTEVLAGQR